MKKSIVGILLIGAFAVSMPFIFNKSIDVAEPHKLDIDGNFILNEWVPSRVGEGKDWDYNLKPVQVSKRVWCFFGAMEMPTKENAGDMSNSCYIKGDTEWIAWDSGPSYVFAKQAYAQMKKIADMPVKNVIISHEHDDHWLGNNYYTEVQGAKIIGPESINENYFGPRHIEGKDYPGLQTRMIKALYQNATRQTVLALPTESFEETTKFEISGVKIEYIKVGYVHSEEDWYLYLPDDKVVLAADTVMNGRVTSNRDGLVVGQINALNSIRSKEWDYLVPGHGFVTDKSAADETVLYFELLKDRIIEKMEDGVIADFITKEVTLNEFRDKDLYYILSPQNVFRSYEELEMFDEDDLIDYEALKEEESEKAEAETKALEAKKVAEEKAKAETKALEAKKVAEEKAKAETKALEAKKVAEEKAKAETKALEAKRVAEEKAKAETKALEAKKVAEEKAKAENKALEAKRVAEEKAKVVEEVKAEAKTIITLPTVVEPPKVVAVPTVTQ